MTIPNVQMLLEAAVLRGDSAAVEAALQSGADCRLEMRHAVYPCRAGANERYRLTVAAQALLLGSLRGWDAPSAGQTAVAQRLIGLAATGEGRWIPRAFTDETYAVLRQAYPSRYPEDGNTVLDELLRRARNDAVAAPHHRAVLNMFVNPARASANAMEAERLLLRVLPLLDEEPKLSPSTGLAFQAVEALTGSMSHPSAGVVEALSTAMVTFSLARRPLLHAAAAAADGGRMLERLLEWGVDPDLRCGNTGRTALMAAAEAGNLNGLKVLIDGGAACGLRDHRGWRAHSYAQRAAGPERRDLCRIFLEAASARSVLSAFTQGELRASVRH